MHFNYTMFRDFTYHWWQFGLFKVSLISLGVIVGSAWPGLFKKKYIRSLLWLGFLIPAIYTAAIAIQQMTR